MLVVAARQKGEEKKNYEPYQFLRGKESFRGTDIALRRGEGEPVAGKGWGLRNSRSRGEEGGGGGKRRKPSLYNLSPQKKDYAMLLRRKRKRKS